MIVAEVTITGIAPGNTNKGKEGTIVMINGHDGHSQNRSDDSRGESGGRKRKDRSLYSQQ